MSILSSVAYSSLRNLRGYNVCDFQIDLKSIGFFYQENKL